MVALLRAPRLLSHKTQENYFNKIVDRYMEFCAAAGREDDKLDRAFASLSIEEDSPHPDWTKLPREELDRAVSRTYSSAPSARGSPETALELETIMMAMRKLREALLASARTDVFAQSAYIFITRAAILTSSYESYQPALLHLLYRVHPVTPLSASELREFVGYRILDLACRLGQYGEAFAVRSRWRFADSRVEGTLQAVVRDDWVKFWRLYAMVDGYQRRLMSWAEDGVRKHALKCLGKSYLTVDRTFIEASACRSWKALKEQDSVGWELEGSKVVVRRVRRR
ncbi:MAG: hypothetical protein MMC23_001833 [Stictis urceolatum]|nr:hypothetical protein [Stictis urceolata]